MQTLSSGPLLTLHTRQPCWSPYQCIHKGSSWRALLRCCMVAVSTLMLFYNMFYSHVVSMVTHHPPEPTEPGKRQDYTSQQQDLSCTVIQVIPDEVLTHSQVLVVRLLPWVLFLVLGSAAVQSQGRAKGGHPVKPWVIVMLLPTTQILTFVPTTSWHLALAGGHCKGGMGRSGCSNRRFFFAKKHPVMANMDLFGYKGFLE